jgi:hypothetical protein
MGARDQDNQRKKIAAPSPAPRLSGIRGLFFRGRHAARISGARPNKVSPACAVPPFILNLGSRGPPAWAFRRFRMGTHTSPKKARQPR